MDSGEGSHLSVILDLSPAQWHLSAQHSPPLTLSTFVSHVMALVNAHTALMHENTLAVFGALPAKSVLLYSSVDAPQTSSTTDADAFPSFKMVDESLVQKITEEMDLIPTDKDEAPTALVAALSKAICYINRLSPPAPRILILSISADQSPSYINIMNAIFSAQKLKITIDACQLRPPNTIFLQQASHLTGGSYILLDEERESLLQYLMMTFLPTPQLRAVIPVPTQEKIDFRAACFCHKNIVDVGFVCSVCLSIYCTPIPVCTTCRTKFPMKTLQRLNASKPIGSAPPSAAPSRANSVAPTAPPNTNGGLPRSGSIRVQGASSGGLNGTTNGISS